MNDSVRCDFCKNIFKSEPMTLPCGWTVCAEHLNVKSMECLICKSHEINYDNCVRARSIEINLLEFKLKQSLQNLKHEFENVNKAKVDPANYIFEYFSDLKNKIDTRKEELIESVNNHFEKLHAQIKELEDKCKQDMQKSIVNKLNLDKHQIKIDSINLSKNGNDKIQIQIDLENDLELVEYIEQELNFHLSSLTDYKRFTFEPWTDPNSDELFGKLEIQDTKDFFNVAGSTYDGSIRLWDLQNGDFNEIKTFQASQRGIFCFSLINNDKLVTGSADGIITIMSLKHGNCLNTFKVSDKSVNCAEALNTNHIICGSDDHSIKVWNLNDGSCFRTLKEHSGDVTCLKVLPNNQLISGSRDKTIKLWNISDGKCFKTLLGHTDSVWCLKYLRNMKLASGSCDSTIKIWDLIEGDCLITLNGHDSFISSLTVCSRGLLISGSDDKTIKVWDTDAGVCVKTLTGNTSLIHNVAILPNDKLISYSDTNCMKIWCLNEGKCIKTIDTSPETFSFFKASYY